MIRKGSDNKDRLIIIGRTIWHMRIHKYNTTRHMYSCMDVRMQSDPTRHRIMYDMDSLAILSWSPYVENAEVGVHVHMDAHNAIMWWRWHWICWVYYCRWGTLCYMRFILPMDIKSCLVFSKIICIWKYLTTDWNIRENIHTL